MKKLITFSIIAILLIALIQCATDKNPLPSVSHPEGWENPEAENFHGNKVFEDGVNFCKPCHGEDFTGGKARKSCYDCHSTYPHQETWMQFGSNQNHGAQIENGSISINSCKTCHGNNLSGGSSGVSCFNCHAQGTLPF